MIVYIKNKFVPPKLINNSENLIITPALEIPFITTNKEISVRVILDKSENLEIIEEGSCVVPGKYFVDIVKRIEGEKVEFALFD